jgi:predicted secreted protein
MNWFVGTATYVVIWWLTIFAVLPWGVKPQENREPGQDAGAPANPRLGFKAAITTGVAAVIWLFVYWAVTHDLVNFRS